MLFSECGTELDLGPFLLERALDESGRLPIDPAGSRLHQARVYSELDPTATDALVLQLFASAPPERGAPRRRPSSSWLALRIQLVEEQGLREGPVLG